MLCGLFVLLFVISPRFKVYIMILDDKVFFAGKITKSHSLYGEVVLEFSRLDIDEWMDLEYVIISLDDILVPFYIEELRTKNSQSLLLKLEGVDSEQDARFLIGKQVFLPVELEPFDGEELTMNDLVDYVVCDVQYGILGEVTHVDDSTLNVLLVVNGDRGEILIPAIDDFVVEINPETRHIMVKLPESLLDLSKAETEE